MCVLLISACNCPYGMCNPTTGECMCPPRVTGERCNTCVSATYGFDPLVGCTVSYSMFTHSFIHIFSTNMHVCYRFILVDEDVGIKRSFPVH